MKKKNQKFTIKALYQDTGTISVIILSKSGQEVSLSPKDFSVKGNILTLNQSPETYFYND